MLTFELDACILRPWRSQDVEALIRHADNRNVWINVRDRFPHPYTRDDALRWLELAQTLPPDTQLAIEVDGEAVGGIGLEPQTDIERVSAEIGFWLSDAAAPSTSIAIPERAPCASWPIRLPSFSASAMYGLSFGASSADRLGTLSALVMPPETR